MITDIEQSLNAVFQQFDIAGQITSAQTYGNGHINDTFLVSFLNKGHWEQYIFQRINHHVFSNPEIVMENFRMITDHLACQMKNAGLKDIGRRVLQLVPTRNGGDFAYDNGGYLWRATRYINGTKTFELVESDLQAYEVGKAYGEYQRYLLALAVESLRESIPEFHNTRSRYDRMAAAINADSFNRAAGAAAEIEYILERERWVDHLNSLKQSGQLPTRTIHNDTKVNNLLIDQETLNGICVTDLDTTMPGLVLYDFGDMVRTVANTAPEDEPDLRKIKLDLGRFQALTEGYSTSAGSFLTELERENLVFSGKLITFELAIRFLTDYFEGDHYFKIDHVDHNLQRCQAQLALVKEIEMLSDQLEKIVEHVFNEQVNDGDSKPCPN